jgi:hypothetical protein
VEEIQLVNDSSWRSLSAILGVACVVLIIAAGALLATNPDTETPGPTGSNASGEPTGAGVSGEPSESVGPSGSIVPLASVTPPPNAAIAQVTFSNMILDASNDTTGQARLFTFITDGLGPVGISVIKYTVANVKVCARVDGSAWDCRYGGKINFSGAYTDTGHSVWEVAVSGRGDAKPTIDLALSWPSNTPSITLDHARFQGSTTPGVSEGLNGFSATFKTRSAGNAGLSASWTAVTAKASVTLADVTVSPAVALDEKQFDNATNLGSPGYGAPVSASRFYKISLRNLSPDSLRPDLRAVITFP